MSRRFSSLAKDTEVICQGRERPRVDANIAIGESESEPVERSISMIVSDIVDLRRHRELRGYDREIPFDNPFMFLQHKASQVYKY
jgi:hypothetical protein